ncbi:MAG: hypothetical protein ACYCX4_05810 [Bacillota bacterium]
MKVYIYRDGVYWVGKVRDLPQAVARMAARYGKVETMIKKALH